MDRELKIRLIEQRINILKTRGETMNAGIIAKLKRQQRRLQDESKA